MTKQQINQAIAEACGIVGKDQYGPLYQTPEGWVVDCPNYCTDLNAMHEAEKVLVNQFTTIEEAYWRNLQQIKPHPIYATARERAEAFLLTLGKWSATDKESLTVGATTEESSVDHLRDAAKMMGKTQP
jgi:hypothetical protein